MPDTDLSLGIDPAAKAKAIQDIRDIIQEVDRLKQTASSALSGLGGGAGAGAGSSGAPVGSGRASNSVTASNVAPTGGGSVYIGGAATSISALSGAGMNPSVLAQIQAAMGSSQPAAFPTLPYNYALGPSSSVTYPGASGPSNQAMMYQYQQMQARNTSMNLIRGMSIAGGISALSSGLSLYASNTANGSYDPMAGASLWGGNIGAVGGGVAGGLMAGPGGLATGATAAAVATGGLLGRELGSSMAQALIAPYVKQRNAELAILSVAARGNADVAELAGSRTAYIRESLNASGRFSFDIVGARKTAGVLSDISESASFGGKSALQMTAIKAGIYTGRDIISLQETADTYSALGSALLSAGEDPGLAVRGTRTLANKYYMGAPGMARLAAPVLAARNRLGRNRADLLLQFGPEAYGAYADATQTDDITPGQRDAYRNVQRADYASRLGSAQIRGSGMAAAAAGRSSMEAISMLPGGRDSLAYAEARHGVMDSMLTGFSQSDAVNFGVPRAQIEGRMTRAQLMPYSPSRMFELAGREIGLNNRQIGSLRSRMSNLRSAGLLSEEQELGMTEQIESLRNATARSLSMISEGRENLIPGLVAGRRASVGSVNSLQLGALSFMRSGLPFRNMGAMGGGQKRFQDAYSDLIGLGEGDIMPHSRSQWMNNSGSGGEGGMMVSLLGQILRTLQGGGSPQGERPGRSFGQAAGIMSQRDVGASNTTVHR